MVKKFIAKKIVKVGKRIGAKANKAMATKTGQKLIPPGSWMRTGTNPAWVKDMNKFHGGRTRKLPKGGKRVLGYGAKEKVVYSQVGHPVHRTVAKQMKNIELHKKSWGNPLTANPKMGKTWKRAMDDARFKGLGTWKSKSGAKYATAAAATGAGIGMIVSGIRQKVTGKRTRVRR